MFLETERLILRDYTDEDKSALIQNIDDLDVTQWLRVVPYPYTEKDADWFLNHCKELALKDPRETYNLVLEEKENKVFLGAIGLSEINYFSGTATIGYWLGKKHHRKGYMYEALKEIIRFAFENLGLRRLDIEADSQNEASNGLIKKAGFTFEGTRKQYRKNKSNNKTPDAHQYGLLKEDWENNKK
jgi:[ribosomal protein S5]-alanine N-acetyltransferase